MVRGYRRFSPEDEDEIWRRMRAGHSMKPAARALVLSTSTVRSYLVRCGGIRPAPRRRSPGRLSLLEREEISRGLAAGLSLRTRATVSVVSFSVGVLKNPSSTPWVAIAQTEAAEQQREAHECEHVPMTRGSGGSCGKGCGLVQVVGCRWSWLWSRFSSPGDVMTAALSRSTTKRRYPERSDEFRIAPPLCVTT